MRVTERMTYDSYWTDPRFADKRPNLYQSMRKSRGDNVYHRNSQEDEWIQEDSCHSDGIGMPNPDHISRDTKSVNVLISDDYVYRGVEPALLIPEFNGESVCHKWMNHRSNFGDVTVEAFIEWIRSLDEWGYCSDPLEWR